MKYGGSDHYRGEQGKTYFAYVNRNARIGAEINTAKFAKFIKSSDRVLDFGCGSGWLLAALSCRERVGVELNKEAHPDCRANGIEVYETIDDVGDREFDVVISNHCLEHVPYPIEALKSLHRIIRENGLLVFVVPIDDWRVQRDDSGQDIDHHLHTWTPRLFANTLVEAGWSIVSIDVLTHAWFPFWSRFYGRIPRPVFDLGCWMWSVLAKKRQIVAVARR